MQICVDFKKNFGLLYFTIYFYICNQILQYCISKTENCLDFDV